MKQASDKSTSDMFTAPRRGRPPTGTAKTGAQRQCEFRQRRKTQRELSLCVTGNNTPETVLPSSTKGFTCQ